MTAGSALCLLLGNATVNENVPHSKVLSAKTTEELVTVKSDLAPASIDKLDVVVDASEFDTLYNPMELANWVPLLKLDATVSIQILNYHDANLEPVHTSFLLAGLSSLSERKEANNSRVLVATRKGVPVMNAKPLKKNPTDSPKVVTLNLGDDVGDDADADMIDEDDLLDDTNLLAPPPAMNAQASASADDCAGRTPCDNCTCGRADAANSGDQQQPKQAPSSSCGKCHLGDAFRCASCPYLGKPAFKAGEEHLVLQLTDDL